jgi:hypothetical protein
VHEDFSHPELNRLPPDIRARVQRALKETLERTIAGESVGDITHGGGGGGGGGGFSRSKGAIFSRSRAGKLMMEADDVVVEKAAQLDDAAFQKFAERLAQLKSMSR